MNKTASLLWVDLEMTGLDSNQDRIIEAAAIATDWDFTEVARFQAAVTVDQKIITARMNDEFWQANSAVRDELIKNSREQGQPIADVESALVKIVGDNFDIKQPIYLAGNSIHQDRRFIEREMPKLNKMLNYRMLDVSAWKVVFEHKYGKKFHKPEVHRALDDIKGSIKELKTYLKKVKI
jgi:oligoribonuclease